MITERVVVLTSQDAIGTSGLGGRLLLFGAHLDDSQVEFLRPHLLRALPCMAAPGITQLDDPDRIITVAVPYGATARMTGVPNFASLVWLRGQPLPGPRRAEHDQLAVEAG